MLEKWNHGIGFYLFNNIPLFHYPIVPLFYSLFPSEPPHQRVHLRGEIRNHDDQNHQQKRIRIDDPQDIHRASPLVILSPV
jgi:hypothetical protein